MKSIDDSHFVVVRSYLMGAQLEHELLLDFARSTLDIERVIANR